MKYLIYVIYNIKSITCYVLTKLIISINWYYLYYIKLSVVNENIIYLMQP